MFEGLKEALQYVNELKEESMQPIVTEIAGKTYCNKGLRRYGMEDRERRHRDSDRKLIGRYPPDRKCTDHRRQMDRRP